MMMLPRLRQLALGVLALAGPSAAFAQPSGVVVTGPLAVGAPALGWPVLAVLALALATGALLMLRRVPQSGARAIAVLGLVLAAASGRAAVLSVIIEGDECNRVNQETYSPTREILLQNQCANSVRILDLELDCSEFDRAQQGSEAAPPPPCEVGLIIPAGDSCALPTCEA
jgi:hypothetical protein